MVKVAVKLTEHGDLGGRRETMIRQGMSDAVDGHSGVCIAEEITSFVLGGAVFAFDSELGCAEGCFPGGPVFGGGGEPVPVWALFGEAAG